MSALGGTANGTTNSLQQQDRDGNEVNVGDEVLLEDQDEIGPFQGMVGQVIEVLTGQFETFRVEFDQDHRFHRASWVCNPCDIVLVDQKSHGKKKQPEKTKVTLDSVIVSPDKKSEIQAAISQVANNDLIFNEWGFDAVFEKGTAISLLFWGIPGTGKTLMAQAIADHLDADLKTYSNAEIQSSEPGGSERTIKEAFAAAKKKNQGKTKQVILFDECDSLLMDRNEVGPILGAMVNCLLSEIEHYDGIVIFTTNRLGKLDPALERRITAKIEFEFPDQTQRKAIWERLIPKKAPLDGDVKLDRLAEYPLAGGNIKNAVLNAARAAAYDKSKNLTMRHFVTAIEREAKSLQAFAAEYEKQLHTSVIGKAQGTTTGATIGQKDVGPVQKMITKAKESLS